VPIGAGEKAVSCSIEHKDRYNDNIVLNSLLRFWSQRKETDLVGRIASIVGLPQEETVALFQRLTEPDSGQPEE
jgi:hypothetical protein